MTSKVRIFCTVFDRNYLYQGVALYKSLEKHAPNFKLYCLALDADAENMLEQLHCKNMIVVSTRVFDQELLATVRARASYAQLCWTFQPLLCRFILNQGEPSVTYIESDSWFFSDPEPHFIEIGENSISLSPHAYSPEFRHHESGSGKFCTQFNYFKNDENGLACIDFWLSNCLEYRAEKSLNFPGQLCLNDWKTRFSGVIVLAHRGGGVAPWNVQKYILGKEGERVTVDEGPLIFYHYHQVARLLGDGFYLGEYPLPQEALQWIYRPYLNALLRIEAEVKRVNPSFNYQRVKVKVPGIFKAIFSLDVRAIKQSLKSFIARMKGTHNIVKLENLSQK